MSGVHVKRRVIVVVQNAHVFVRQMLTFECGTLLNGQVKFGLVVLYVVVVPSWGLGGRKVRLGFDFDTVTEGLRERQVQSGLFDVFTSV